MCTILTLDRTTFDTNPTVYLDRVRDDFRINNDGAGMLVYDPAGASEASKQFTLIRTFDINYVLWILQHGTWERFWLHQRFATQGAVSVDNIHMWSLRGIYWCHNGHLWTHPANKVPVDSMAIGHWIKSVGVAGTVDLLHRKESYANVFMVDTRTRRYTTVRCTSGSLYTDGYGNYSTNRVGLLTADVNRDSECTRDMDSGEILSTIPGRTVHPTDRWWENEEAWTRRWANAMPPAAPAPTTPVVTQPAEVTTGGGAETAALPVVGRSH